MNLHEALDISKEYQNQGAISPDDEFLLIEAWDYLINHYGDTFEGSVYMFNLGDHYLRHGEYQLALKYLERSVSCDNEFAGYPLGIIWYYGLAGKTDYEKAYNLFTESESLPQSKLMLAEMHKEGHFVKKDISRYRQYIFDAFEQVWDSPVPNCKGEVFYKYAEIVMEEEKDGNRREEIAVLLIKAENSQQEQMQRYASEHDFEIMKKIKMLLHRLGSDLKILNIFDLYWALSRPACIQFTFPEMDGAEFGDPDVYIPAETYIISSHDNGNSLEIFFDENWYKDIDHFFREATIDGMKMQEISYLLTDFKFIKPTNQ